MNPVSTRVRRHRQRKAEGVAVLQIEINMLDLTDLLVAAKLLEMWDADDKAKVAQAAARFLKAAAREHETRFGFSVRHGA